MRYVAMLTALVTLAALAPPASLAADASAPPARYCHGKRATIADPPGKKIRGTSAADVIVSNGAYSIDGRGGDDLICVTGDSGQGTVLIVVLGGAGDDVIDASRARELVGVSARLGKGRDAYVGSPGADYVDAMGGGRDTIATGVGRDSVTAGGENGGADHDVVHLGPGDDRMDRPTRDPTTRWYGDGGTDTLQVPSDGPESRVRHRWVYDNVRHAALRDGVPVQRWRGFERFNIAGSPVGAAYGRSIRFVGGPDPETVILSVPYRTPTRVNLGAGDDRLETAAGNASEENPRRVFTGGPGRDLFRPSGGYYDRVDEFAYRTPYLAIDLAAGTLTNNDGTGPADSLKGFEDVDATYFDEADLTGTDADNLLVSQQSCTGHLSGGGGDDVLALGARTYPPSCDRDGQPGPVPGATLDGGAGDDALTGGDGNDTLIGGADTDTADGGLGVDSCDAETRVDCEP